MVIAELAVGGGMLGIGPMPGRGGAYVADLADLLDWAPDMVLTMTTSEELAAKGAGCIPGDLGAAGVTWVHLPIGDFGAPTGETLAAWPEAAARARQVLAAGGRVWVHCLGGCGRSGTAALRLMVEAGEEPSTALERLRAVRPCAVETPEQFSWAAAGGAL
ncbi:protein-tyrosine phosphatase family protein [Tabrizicola sp.]|uniref:protein-tyrosine phosphatase family protein n=1 Tax=Tabrizicola sp. TaxID=2005166 RepID=UPI0027347C57|nr:protein-tyrosine phosphatase family protein [Tabrizicola sp.]MDP3195928.1 protein-tyrosine phosphatase family protein [Tabrizicola sp.]